MIHRTICAVKLGLIAASFFAIAAQAESRAPKKAVEIKVDIDKAAIKADQEGVVYVLVRLSVPEALVIPVRKRPPLNIALVLDRSGSMSGKGKIEHLKASAKRVIDRLKRQDRLSIVSFDDRIEVNWPSSSVEAANLVKRVVDDLQPRGSTNISGGMIEGVKQIRSRLRAGSVNRVVLLSDGLANRGLVHPLDFRTLLNRSDMRGIPVTTLGLGLNYNEDLMQAIAEDSGGAYYYIESPVQIASVFQRELSSLFKTVASDILFQFNASPAVRSVQVFGYPSKNNGAATKVELSSLFAGESRNIVLRLDLNKHHVGKVDLGDIRLFYRDVTDGHKVTMNNSVTVTATKDDDVILKASNKDTIVIAKLTEAEARQRIALNYAQKGDWERAKQEIADAADDIRKTNSRFNDARLNTKLEALRVEEKMVEKSANVPQATASKQFMKRSKQRLYQAYQGKRGGFSYKPGDSGDHVRHLQIALAKVGYYKGPKNGRYTKMLRNAVRSYQKDQKLKVDGVAGPMTLHRLKIY